MQVQFDNGYIGKVPDKVGEILVKRGGCKKIDPIKPDQKPAQAIQGGKK